MKKKTHYSLDWIKREIKRKERRMNIIASLARKKMICKINEKNPIRPISRHKLEFSMVIW